MTRDQVERLLEGAVLGVEKRLAQQQQQQQQQLARGEVQLATISPNGAAAGVAVGAATGAAAGSPQLKVVRSLKPLAEGEPLGPSAHDAAAAALAAAAAPQHGPSESSQRGGSSVRGGSTRGSGDGMQRVRSLSAVQQAMSRAYQSGGTGAGSRMNVPFPGLVEQEWFCRWPACARTRAATIAGGSLLASSIALLPYKLPGAAESGEAASSSPEGTHDGAHEGTRHSHVSWADEVVVHKV